MKIGILTFVNAMNFGAVLQAYGTEKYLTEKGFESVLIDYTPVPKAKDDKSCKKSSPIINKLSLLKHPFAALYGKIKRKKIDDFKSENLKISSDKYIGEILKLKEDYDVIIAGSDQIWNTDLSFGSRTFFFDFDTKAKKVGYAVSVGKKNFSNQEKEMIHKFAKNFDALSVRENSLKEYLSEKESTNSVCVCDPVFLPDKTVWDNLTISPSYKDFIFVYSMEFSSKLVETANILQKLTGKKMYFISAGGNNPSTKIHGKSIKASGPKEFLGLIKNADIVLTNSFHGVAFRLIFGGDLFVVEHSKRNERLVQILSLCNCSEKIIPLKDNDFDINKNSVDSNSAYKELKNFIDNSRDFLINQVG